MKGSTPSAADKALWDKLSRVGCICCLHDGRFNPYGVIHHVDGRTKKGAHQKVLFLCAPHHQQDDASGVWAVHPNKGRFESEYGSQVELMAEQKMLAGVSAN